MPALFTALGAMKHTKFFSHSYSHLMVDDLLLYSATALQAKLLSFERVEIFACHKSRLVIPYNNSYLSKVLTLEHTQLVLQILFSFHSYRVSKS